MTAVDVARRRVRRGLRAALAVVMAMPAVRAAAQTVSAPTGATLPSGSPVLVQWTPSGWASPTVGITLYGNQGPATPVPGAYIAPLVTNVANNGQAYVTLPASLACDPSYVYQIAVWADVTTPVVMRSSTFSRSFKLSCAAGSITVVKTVIVNGAVGASSQTFPVHVACTPGGPTTTVSLNSANAFQATVTSVPLNRHCAITEAAPRAPVGCRWNTTYPLGNSVDITGNATYRREVRNELDCVTRIGAGRGLGTIGSAIRDTTATLTVTKKIVNDSPNIPPPSLTFDVKVACTPNGPNATLTLSSANGYAQDVPGIAALGNCTIVEAPPAVPPELARRGCHWETSYPDGRIAAFGTPAASVRRSVVNRWTCKPGS